MGKTKKLLLWLIRVVFLMTVTAATMLLVGMYLGRRVINDVGQQLSGQVQQVSDLLTKHTEEMRKELAGPREETVEIDFYEASGVKRDELQGFLEDLAKQDGVTQYPLIVTLQDDDGNYLTRRSVTVQWDAGKQKITVGNTGAFGFLVSNEKLQELKIIAPQRLCRLEAKIVAAWTSFGTRQGRSGSTVRR